MDSESFMINLSAQIQQLKSHPHVESISQIQPLSYKIGYWPQNLQSVFSQKAYKLKLTISQKFPQEPPKLYFIDKIYHLNIHPNSGQVNMPILKDDWSPYIGLKAIIQSLDLVLEQADENYPATNAQLKQYNSQLPKYVQKVKKALNLQEQRQMVIHQNESNQVVEEVIQVEQYLNNNKKQAQQKNKKIQGTNKKNKKQILNQEAKNAQSLGLAFSQVHKDQQNKRMFIEDEFVQTPVDKGSNTVKTKNAEQQKKQNQSNINEDSIKSLKQVANSSKNGKNETYQNLKQTLIKANQLLDIFSQECQIIENRINKTSNTKIKKVMQQKIITLQNTILQIFQITSELNKKILQIVKKESKPYL